MEPMPLPAPITALLRGEGLAELAVLVAAYALQGESWWWFAGLFLAPDLGMLGYLAGPRVGAACYNAAHLLIGPALLGGAAWWGAWGFGVALALIWAAHIQFDRALGYGLKFASGFGHTHLGLLGRAA